MSKKKTKIVITLVIVAIIGILGIVGLSTEAENTTDSSVLKKWGNYLSDRFHKNTKVAAEKQESIYAEGKRAAITVDDMKQTIEYYALQGISEEEAEKQAYEYMKESASLYQEALEQGYSVTAEEVHSYVESLKEMMSSEELDEISREQIDNVISGFGSEEEYWKYQEEVYQELLVSQKYVGDLQREFYEDGVNGQEEWISYFENFKRKLVEEEDFQIVGELK